MLESLMHAWERHLVSITKDRVVRPFEWGDAWMPADGHPPPANASSDPLSRITAYVDDVMTDTDAFYTPGPTSDYTRHAAAEDGSCMVTFPSALETPHPSNNTVYARLFTPRRNAHDRRAAVLVLPQWNADAGGHVGLCRLLTMGGMTALRLSLPYHDLRMPPELHRADYIVSANVMRTLQVCRQAVLDARRAIAWLHREGYERIGILGSSLGSCLSLLTTAHEPLIRAQALNHISPYFADVVWRGLSTAHVREGLDGHIDLDLLRQLWRPISPAWYLDRIRDRKTLLVYAKYDLTFPVDLSRKLVRQFTEQGVPFELKALSCGHYSIGKTPFKFLDGWILMSFLRRTLLGSAA
ncbi:MAG: abhydrolase domain-containing 18 [Acidobacteriaceae bacterium]|jgi:dienelactone hydrolase|nr:abhydrolase domain-containing 18 [Acidobacteriaceae bacterium]